ncbi:MAG TPA: hypothetical protein VFE50_15040 [Cyclobacteriaceae bacterium]|nr:hypothetical protein [Cyclobacteriaceae bacterium]
MKRLFAIVILNIFLLNVLGYYGVLLGLKTHSGDELSQRLDSDMYDLGATVTFQVPLTMPYATDSHGYERVDGEFEKDGAVYRMVKQRYYQDVLYIVCIKDEKTTHINNALEDFVQSFAGQDDDNSQQHTSAPSLIKDYVDYYVTLTPSVNGWEKEVTNNSVARNLIDSYFASIIHPPDRA